MKSPIAIIPSSTDHKNTKPDLTPLLAPAAVGLGLLLSLCTVPNLAALKAQLQLNHTSTILLFSTEGNTDPAGYATIVNQAI